MKHRFEDIPADVLYDIAFMLGSIEECTSEYLKPVLVDHGYADDADEDIFFLTINPEDDKELTVDIYEKIYLSGILAPVLPMDVLRELYED